VRKLAREATIFTFLGLCIAVVGYFVFLTKDIRAKTTVAAARDVHAFAFGREPVPHDVGSGGEFLPNGFVATKVAAKDAYEGYDDVKDDYKTYDNAEDKLADSIVFHHLVEVRLTNGLFLYIEECRAHAFDGRDCVFLPDSSSIEKDYWAAYKKYEHDSLFENGIASLHFGLWGFPGGLGIWLLYRLVRFAIKG